MHMTSYYNNLVTMMQILTNWALDAANLTTTSSIPVFKKGIDDVKTKINQATLLNQMLSLTGIAQDKKQSKTLLCQILVSITYPTKSFAVITKNNTLFQEIKLPISTFLNLGTNTLINKAHAIHNLILPLIPSMQEQGFEINEQDLESLLQAINAFEAVAQSPKNSIGNRKGINQQINTLIKDANHICHQILDENIISFKNTHPDFYNLYAIKRQVNKQGYHTRLAATVTNDGGQPIFGATVTVNPLQKDGKTFKAVSNTTNLQGQTIVSTFESGYRTVTVSGSNVVSKTFGPFKFQHGKEFTETFSVAATFNIPEHQPQAYVKK